MMISNLEKNEMSKNTIVHYECECGHVTKVTIYPTVPATWTSPEEGGDYDPGECEKCDEPFDDDIIDDLCLTEYHNDLAAQEAKWDEELHRRKEGG
jgi:hypothetical protein